MPLLTYGVQSALESADIHVVVDDSSSTVALGVVVCLTGIGRLIQNWAKHEYQAQCSRLGLLVSSLNQESLAQVSHLGCVFVLDLESAPELVAAAARASFSNMVTYHVAGNGTTSLGQRLGEDSRTLLAALSTGESISNLAFTLGYSRRSLHRRLTTLYSALGVDSRSEAVAEALRSGLI